MDALRLCGQHHHYLSNGGGAFSGHARKKIPFVMSSCGRRVQELYLLHVCGGRMVSWL
jgi:hypothetical protein